MRTCARLMLFVPLLLAYWYVHAYLAIWVAWVPDLFSERPWQLAGLLAGAVLCGALAGAILAGPFRLLYREQALPVAVAASLLAGAFEALYMRLDGVRPFVATVLLLDLAVFVVALPLCVLALKRWRPAPAPAPAV